MSTIIAAAAAVKSIREYSIGEISSVCPQLFLTSSRQKTPHYAEPMSKREAGLNVVYEKYGCNKQKNTTNAIIFRNWSCDVNEMSK